MASGSSQGLAEIRTWVAEISAMSIVSLRRTRKILSPHIRPFALSGALLVALAMPSPVRAQAPYEVPLFELAGGAGRYNGVGLINVGTTANLTQRWGIEVSVDAWDLIDSQQGAYFILGKYAVRDAPAGPKVLFTFGGSGRFARVPIDERRLPTLDGSTVVFESYTQRRMTSVRFAAVGAEIFHRLARHLAIRANAAFVIGGDRELGYGTRLTSGVAIPMGAYERRSSSGAQQ